MNFIQLAKTLLLKPFLIALIISFLTTPLVIVLAKKLGLVDDPRKRIHPAHTHRGIIPRAGGLSVFLGIIFSIFFLLPLTKQVAGVLLGAGFLIAVGLLDDKYDLNPYFRFITNIIAAGLAVAGGVGISYITNPFDSLIYLDRLRISFYLWGPHSIVLWADIFALIWIVWCVNIVNWSKGVDGQMPGFVAISAVTIGILSFRFIKSGDLTQWIPASLAFITAGAFLGFLPFNFYPQKIMPGYGGGSLAGYLLAVLSILSGAKLGTAILVLSIPMSDALYTFSRRVFAGKSPFLGDKGHLHHRLLSAGWGRRRIALFYWSFTAILGIVALNLKSKEKIFAIIMIGVLIGAVLLWLNLFSYLRKNLPKEGKMF